MPDINDLGKTLQILRSDSTSIKQLAELSGMDVFRFFNHSDLTNLDLSKQDLTGLNFFGANLQNTNLDKISFDIGAFNGAILSEKYATLADDFEFCLSDILDEIFDYIYVYVQFRSESLEKAVSNLRLTYGDLAHFSNINVSTLRKARRSEIIALDTAQRIASSLIRVQSEKSSSMESNLLFPEDFRERRRNVLLQPMIRILQFNNNDRFTVVSSQSFRIILDHKRVIKSRLSRDDGHPPFRFTPNVLETMVV